MMNRKTAKLSLHRETLRLLSTRDLRRVAGGSGNTTCYSDLSNCLSNYPGFCDPSVDSACVSRCLACPDVGPSVAC